MLKKKNRLGKSKFAGGNFFKRELFNFKISDGLGDTKFGFSVSKKVSKSAVLRNKTKRILSKIIEDNLDKINSNKRIVIIAKKALDKKEKISAEKIILDLFKKEKILQ